MFRNGYINVVTFFIIYKSLIYMYTIYFSVSNRLPKHTRYVFLFFI